MLEPGQWPRYYEPMKKETTMTKFSITPKEQQAMSNATPRQWVAAIVKVATDLSFWKELTVTMLTAFAGGFERGRR